MLSTETIEAKIAADRAVIFAKVTGDGYHFQAEVVSDVFEGLSRVARQQWVYAKLKPWISSGELHAISIQTWTSAQWENKNG